MNEKIKEIKSFLDNRHIRWAKSKLDELEKELENLEGLKKFAEEMKRLSRESGKSNMISIETIEQLIVEHLK